MSKKSKLRFKNGPEWEQYDKFKGKIIRIEIPPYDMGENEFGANLVMVGKLIWVDMYTLGILFTDATEPSIVYKGPGMVISLSD